MNTAFIFALVLTFNAYLGSFGTEKSLLLRPQASTALVFLLAPEGDDAPGFLCMK